MGSDMDIHKTTAFFLWCTIINGVLLFIGIIGVAYGPDLGNVMQSDLFSVPEMSVNLFTYQFLGLFKLIWVVFNLTPYIALRIISKA